jgi:hypothetical protein
LLPKRNTPAKLQLLPLCCWYGAVYVGGSKGQQLLQAHMLPLLLLACVPEHQLRILLQLHYGLQLPSALLLLRRLPLLLLLLLLCIMYSASCWLSSWRWANCCSLPAAVGPSV